MLKTVRGIVSMTIRIYKIISCTLPDDTRLDIRRMVGSGERKRDEDDQSLKAACDQDQRVL